MTQAINLIQSFIVRLFDAIMAAIGAIQTLLLGLMTQAHVPADTQKAVLVIVAVLLIVAAIRLFGRVFGILIAIFLILLILHALLPGLSGSAPTLPR